MKLSPNAKINMFIGEAEDPTVRGCVTWEGEINIYLETIWRDPCHAPTEEGTISSIVYTIIHEALHHAIALAMGSNWLYGGWIGDKFDGGDHYAIHAIHAIHKAMGRPH